MRPLLNSCKLHLLMAFVLGSLSALAMPPYGLFPILIVSLGFLYWACRMAARPLRAFFIGWLFSFGFFVFGLMWVGNALRVEGNPYAWAWPLAVCGLPFLLAFFQGFACLLARGFLNLETLAGFLGFVAFSAFFEWARGHAFTGFPWNLYGHTWAHFLPMLQILSVLNIYWLSFFTILWMAAPVFFITGRAGLKQKQLLGLVLGGLFVFCLSFGFWRLEQPMPPPREDVRVHLVQANISQSDKWKADKMWDQFLSHIALSQPGDASYEGVTLVIWAETALNHWVLQHPEAIPIIRRMLSAYNGPAYLLTGYLRQEPETERYFNSLIMIDKQGQISNVYDKNHLVPFGEYIPFQKWIPLKPVAEFSGFAGGSGPVTHATPEGISYSPAICYEIIFPGAVVDRRNPPSFILNVTNDSWYGDSAGPRQHFYQAVYRAIEEGLPVVRVADTGITTVTDPYGHIIEKSALFEQYEITLALPAQIMAFNANNMTKDTGLLVILLCLIFYSIFSHRKKLKA